MLSLVLIQLIHCCRVLSTASLAVLVTSASPASPTSASDPATIALWGVVVTSIAGIVLQMLRTNAEAKRDERRHRFETEDRRAAERARQDIFRALKENAVLTEKGSAKADAAYEAANDVTAKIVTLAVAALSPGSQSVEATEALQALKDHATRR